MNLEPHFTHPSLRHRKNDRKIQELIHQRNFADAQRLIQQKIEGEPHNPDGYHLEGVLFSYTGKIGKAIESFRKALKIDPKHTDTAICLSVLLNDIGRYDEAKKVFEHANTSIAEKRPGDDRAVDRKFSVKHVELADLYYRYKRFDEAIEEYSKAIQLDPKNLEVFIKRSKAYYKKGFVSRAIQELQTLKKENPGYTRVRIQLGLFHLNQGNVLDAELEWETALEFDPNNKQIKDYLKLAQSKR